MHLCFRIGNRPGRILQKFVILLISNSSYLMIIQICIIDHPIIQILYFYSPPIIQICIIDHPKIQICIIIHPKIQICIIIHLKIQICMTTRKYKFSKIHFCIIDRKYKLTKIQRTIRIKPFPGRSLTQKIKT